MDILIGAGIGVVVMGLTALGGQLTRYGRALPDDLVAPASAKYGYATIRQLERTRSTISPEVLGQQVIQAA